MFNDPYFRKTGTFRYNGVVPKDTNSTPFQNKKVHDQVSYQCSSCTYLFSRRVGFKGSLSRCPYCGKDGTVARTKQAQEFLN